MNRLPAVCQQYRHKLLRCLESSHYPAAAKEGQRLALQQMLAIVAQQQQDPSAGDLAAASDNCRDSLSTLEQSAKVSCPEVF